MVVPRWNSSPAIQGGEIFEVDDLGIPFLISCVDRHSGLERVVAHCLKAQTLQFQITQEFMQAASASFLSRW
jgi:hypothetical protein